MHQVVSSAIGAVNPQQIVGIQVNVGVTENADGTTVPAYATPGSITASIGGTFTASLSGTTLSVSAVLTGSLQVGDAVSGDDGINSLPASCSILAQLSGTAGGIGTYQVSAGTLSGVLDPTTVTSASTVLNASAVVSGALQGGQTLADGSAALLPGTLITGQLQGETGGSGLYSISQQQTVAAETMTLSMTLLAQVQPLAASELRHMDMLNLQGSHRALYINAPIRGIQRGALKGGDLIALPDGTKWLVTQPLESFYATAGFQKVAITLQDDS